jgi:hypothetical protein
MGSAFVDAALRYAHLGLAVIPLLPKEKRPMFANWPEVATTDQAVISRWWQQTPQANVGIVTGRKSGIFVLDVDPNNGGRESFEDMVLRHGRFPETLQQITGSKGWHLFFRYPSFPVHNAAGLLPGIDIRGDGGQVVAPPSIHPKTGLTYEWDGLDEIENTRIAEAPLWLLELLDGKNSQHGSQHMPIAEKIPHGVQHYTLLALAGALRRMGLSENDMLPTLIEVNRNRCEQPGLDRAVQQIAHSVMKYRPADNDLFRTASKLWRLTKAKEHEARERDEKLGLAVVDGLTVYRSSGIDQKCVIQGILYNGLTVFAGRPKVGKSWLTLQLALAVAQGEKLMGALDVNAPGGVVYIALEESQSRTATRMQRLVGTESPFLQNISMVYEMSPLKQGGAEQLEKILADRHPSLVIIDTFLALVGGGSERRDVLRSEYQEMKTVADIARRAETAMVLVHHMRKSVVGENGIDSVAGSTGVTAAADAIWTLKREDQQTGMCSFDVVGREVEEQSLAIRFRKDDPLGWEMVGQGFEIKAVKDQREIVTLLREEGALTPAKVATLLRMNANHVRASLQQMHEMGLVNKQHSGSYTLTRGYEPEGQDAA